MSNDVPYRENSILCPDQTAGTALSTATGDRRTASRSLCVHYLTATGNISTGWRATWIAGLSRHRADMPGRGAAINLKNPQDYVFRNI